jgi:formylglycine-generating enzyme required for sulfatase activity
MMLLMATFIAPNAWAGQQVPVPEMVSITGGTFSMGGQMLEELPEHAVDIRPFAISKFEVTFEQYDAFAKAAGRKLPNDGGYGRGRRPVFNVTWNDAVAYAEWLSRETGKRFRLPTEAEWEYAARAGSKTPYWWGTKARGSNRANCDGCGSEWAKQTTPVGSFEANPFGLHDTAGNVIEWVQDCWHENYENAPADGSVWLKAGDGDCGQRVIRGGHWFHGPGIVHSAYRGKKAPDYQSTTAGFRLAQDLE